MGGDTEGIEAGDAAKIQGAGNTGELAIVSKLDLLCLRLQLERTCTYYLQHLASQHAYRQLPSRG
jgi:hypothetical protein